MPRIHQTKIFLEKKENQAWNLKQRIGILVERNEIITAANLVSFASRSYWMINEGKKKKSNKRIVLRRGKETWRKERRETIRERDLWEEERLELMTVRVWGERKQREERKLTTRERMRQKIIFPTATNEDNIYRRCNVWERNCFPIFFFFFLENYL